MSVIKSICKLVFLICSISLTHAAKSHTISTLINAKWHLTPIQLEIAEYLSETSNQKFWIFVDKLTSLKVNIDELENDLSQYQTSIDVASSLLSEPQMKLLKLSLSLHSMTPRIQSHLMIADDLLKHGDCEKSNSFVVVGSELICSKEELKKKLKSPASSENSDLYSFDHIYPGTETNDFVLILYGEIGSKEFNEYHNVLKTEVQNGKIKYVTRHFIRNRSNSKVSS
jgi:UDP-glucose:glycoprotein glucosyltransferase